MKNSEIIILTADEKRKFVINMAYKSINNILFAEVRIIYNKKPLYFYGDLSEEPKHYKDVKLFKTEHIRFRLKEVF